jgi:hypothetical protein
MGWPARDNGGGQGVLEDLQKSNLQKSNNNKENN